MGIRSLVELRADGSPPAQGASLGCIAALDGLRALALLAVILYHARLPHRSYFLTVGRPPLLQHLWSLAVEE